jgi:4-methylaminobutanoate oxidase (formaldehyde-forming)
MNSVGVATGGGAGMALAHCIVEGHPPYDLHEADPNRFAACFASVEALSARVPEVLGRHYEITYPGRQWFSARDLRVTPLDAEWRAAKAHMGQFYGFERPLYFDKAQEPALTFGRPAWFDQVGREVRQAHEAAAIFDQSTFGKIRVEGPDAEAFLNRVCANDMTRPPGRAIYTAMLNERGGFESDLTALRLSEESYRLYVGTSAIEKDLAWLRRHLGEDERVALSDETEDYAVLGLMGPGAAGVAERIGAPPLNDLGYFRHQALEVAGLSLRAARLSYVGEAGWEITCRVGAAAALYRLLRDAGARPSGLFAQTSMRIEKRFLAMGHDLDSDIGPLEAGLEFAVAWGKNFIGREALLRKGERGPASRLLSVVLQDREVFPLGNEPLLGDGRIIGKTTSAAFGYRIGRPVALAFVERTSAEEGAPVELQIAGEPAKGLLRLAPAFDPDGRRMRP